MAARSTGRGGRPATAGGEREPRTAGHGVAAPPPPARRKRTAGDVVRAFAALVALLALVGGVPLGLAVVFGWPLPHGVPSTDTLRAPITVETFENVLAVVVWIAWAQFTACVLVEARAAFRGVGMPARVPGAGASQLLARQLIAAVLLIGAGAASLTPGLGALGHPGADGPHRAAASVSAARNPLARQVASTEGLTAAQRAADADAARGGVGAGVGVGTDAARGGATVTSNTQAEQTKYYRIQPPDGRHHDSLWEIAQRHLGDGRRYKEIYRLNKDRTQPDGSKLSQASLIRPGWILEMPADAHGGDLVEMPHDAGHVPSSERHDIQHYQHTGTAAQHTAHQQGGAGHEAGGGAGSGGGASGGAQGGAGHATAAGHDTQHATAAHDGDTARDVAEALVGAPLLAAGLLAALGRRRRAALWDSVTRGRFRSPVTPDGDAADVFDALRIGADPDAVRFLDRALRALSASLAAEGRALPTVYAAWITPDALHLQLAWAEGEPPDPWLTGQDATFWRLERAALPESADTSAAAPFPGLAGLGTLDGARLLLNLEAVPGVVALRGERADRTAVLASIASELATNGWSDRMTVTLVGFDADLTALAPTRIRHLADVAEAIETMTAESATRVGALRNAGQDSVLTGRSGPNQHTQWAPHLVLVATPPTPEQALRLAELATDAGRLGIGYLVAADPGSELTGAAWELEITPAGRLLAPLLGLDLLAQRLPARQYAAVLRLFAEAARVPDGGPSPDGPYPGPDGPDTDPAAPAFLVDLTDQGRPGVYARLLGSFELVGLPPADPERRPQLHEALALLLLHREGVHPRVLAAALWPRGVTEDVRDALVGRLGEWLGADPDGAPRLSVDEAGRLRLARSVVSDWDVLQTLHHEATEGGGADDPRLRRRLLRDALALARGPLLADRAGGRRYGWLAHEIVDAQLPVLVAEVALGLAALRLEAGKPEGAVEAVETALAVAPDDERLWLQLLRATAALDDPARLAATADTLLARDASRRGLPPRVEALLDELLPAWRGRIAN